MQAEQTFLYGRVCSPGFRGGSLGGEACLTHGPKDEETDFQNLEGVLSCWPGTGSSVGFMFSLLV